MSDYFLGYKKHFEREVASKLNAILGEMGKNDYDGEGFEILLKAYEYFANNGNDTEENNNSRR